MAHLIEIRDLHKTYVIGDEPVHALDGVSLTAEFLMALNKLQKTDSYTLKTIKDIFLEAPERRAWER